MGARCSYSLEMLNGGGFTPAAFHPRARDLSRLLSCFPVLVYNSMISASRRLESLVGRIIRTNVAKRWFFSSNFSLFLRVDRSSNGSFVKNSFQKLFPFLRRGTIKFLLRRWSIDDNRFEARIRSMFHFEHVNEIVSRVSFVSWIIPSPPPDPSIPGMARSSQVFGSGIKVSRHRLARLKTSVSSSYITIFPRTEPMVKEKRGRGRGEGRRVVDGQRKRECNGFP